MENRSYACIYACIYMMYTVYFEVTLGVLLVCSSACARVHVLVSVEPPSISDHTAAISLNSLYLANRVLVTRFCLLCSTEWHCTQLLDVIVASWKFYIFDS